MQGSGMCPFESRPSWLQVSEYVSQLRRVGKGLGVWQWDQQLLAEVKAAAAN